ncbi:MAG: GspH/FimT family pseudopilin [Granulosicoccus sp.]
MLDEPQSEYGFTLLELIITMAIGAILLSLAMPSFRSMMGDSAMTGTANDFVFALQAARSEAIKRSGVVGMCASAAPLVDDATCAGGYNGGWLVYADLNSDGDRDDPLEPLILQVEARNTGFTFTPSSTFTGADQQIHFSSSGGSINSTGIPLSGTITIDYADEQRVVTVSANGRISTATP